VFLAYAVGVCVVGVVPRVSILIKNRIHG
jgi:hypothetical protein